MAWEQQHSVGMDEIDAQHRYFFALLEQIEVASKAHSERRFPFLLEELLRYTRFHFRSEEALMESYCFVGDSHRREHENLLRQAEEMSSRTDVRPAALRLFMYKWIVNHIQLEDMELAKFVSSKRRELRNAVAALVPPTKP